MRTLIVDDERLARQKIRTMLGAHADVVIIGECKNGLEAVEAIRKSSPDLVFLDIQSRVWTDSKSFRNSRERRCRSSFSSPPTTSTRSVLSRSQR